MTGTTRPNVAVRASNTKSFIVITIEKDALMHANRRAGQGIALDVLMMPARGNARQNEIPLAQNPSPHSNSDYQIARGKCRPGQPPATQQAALK